MLAPFASFTCWNGASGKAGTVCHKVTCFYDFYKFPGFFFGLWYDYSALKIKILLHNNIFRVID